MAAKTRKKEVNLKLVVILTICLALVSSMTFIFYSYWYVKEVKIVPMSVQVSDYAGLDTNKTMLKFGVVMPGSEIYRSMIINHNKEYPLKANIRMYGEMQDWVTVSENNFVVEPGKSVSLNAKVRPPLETPYGNYSGYMKITFTR